MSKDETMTIQEAIKLAMEKDEYITRKTKMFQALRIKPTNTDDCFVIFVAKEYIHKFKKEQIGKRWNPKAEDILANDWVVKPL